MAIGTLIRDAETKQIGEKNTTVINFSTAQPGSKDSKKNVFYGVSIFPTTDKSAEFLGSLKKGTVLIFTDMSITGGSEKPDPKDAEKTNVSVYARAGNVTLVSSPKDGETSTSPNTAPAGASGTNPWDE